MSRILLYVDEDAMDGDFVEAVRVRGVDVITVADAGMLHRTDEEQLAWATERGRVLFSCNVGDFYHLHTERLEQGMSHAGIVLVQQQRYGIGELMRGVLSLMYARSAEDMVDNVEFLSGWMLR